LTEKLNIVLEFKLKIEVRITLKEPEVHTNFTLWCENIPVNASLLHLCPPFRCAHTTRQVELQLAAWRLQSPAR
jgi:hypothetical protein